MESNKLNSYFKLLRPHHWIKNTFIFLPIFFAKRINNFDEVSQLILAFISFSLLASVVYIINDIIDIEKDKLHPKKRFRPLASGEIKKNESLVFASFLFIGSLTLVFLGNNAIGLLTVLSAYFIQNIFYTFYLKKIAIIDVMVIATGFVLRLYAGSAVTGVELSIWIILMTFLLSLFLGFAKRRDDVLIYQTEGTKARSNIARYNEKFVDSVLNITASITIVCYIMYCISPEVQNRFNTDKLYFSSVFVIAGIVRYLQATLVDERTGNPTKMVLQDRFLQLIILGWIVTLSILIY